MKEYWVIEESRTGSVFGPGHGEAIKGYIPRSVGEKIIGHKTKKGACVWFTSEQAKAMREHPEFITELPNPTEAEND